MSAIRFGTGQPRRFATHVRFVLDAQLSPALARALREAGHDVRALRELGLRDAEDSEIWDYALANQACHYHQDFAEWLMSRRTAPVIVWLRIGNSNRALVMWLLSLWRDIIRRIEAGDNLVEVREKR